MSKLNHKKIAAFKPAERHYRKADGEGLSLEVRITGSKLWRFRYRWNEGEKMLSLGKWPLISIPEARKRCFEMQKMLHSDPPVDPSAVRAAKKRETKNTFESVALKTFNARAAKLAKSTVKRDRRFLDKLIERLGKRPIATLTKMDLSEALTDIQTESAVRGDGGETAKRCATLLNRIYSTAMLEELVTVDVSAGLAKTIEKAKSRPRPAITDRRQLARLLRAIDGVDGVYVKSALQLLTHTLLRPGELRLARWNEIDFEQRLWVVPQARMKMGKPHVVPLSPQVFNILGNLYELTGGKDDGYILPGARPGRPISPNTLNLTLRSLGFSGDLHTSHGFRSTASTLLHEDGNDSDTIEIALSHQIAGVKGIYHRSHLLDQRRELLAQWSDYLEILPRSAHAQ